MNKKLKKYLKLIQKKFPKHLRDIQEKIIMSILMVPCLNRPSLRCLQFVSYHCPCLLLMFAHYCCCYLLVYCFCCLVDCSNCLFFNCSSLIVILVVCLFVIVIVIYCLKLALSCQSSNISSTRHLMICLSLFVYCLVVDNL